MTGTEKTFTMPLLPMRDLVIFPYMTTPFFIGREQSLNALEDALSADRRCLVLTQKASEIERPEAQDLYQIGTVSKIVQVMRLPNGTVKVLCEGEYRAKVINLFLDQNAYAVEVEQLQDVSNVDVSTVALAKNIKSEVRNYLKRTSRQMDLAKTILEGTHSYGEIADLIIPILQVDIYQKQELLETTNVKRRLEIVYTKMLEEIDRKKLEHQLKERVQGQIGRSQKEYYLNEQMKAIQRELGTDEGTNEIEAYRKKIKECKMSEEAKEVANKELKKLQQMSNHSSEANIVRNYIEWLIQVPWSNKTTDNYNLKKVQNILDQDHYGLEKVKERIIEHIAVGKMVGKMKGPILCLIGPPGVGKTSLAQSVARALGRKFVRMSLGGVRDEAEIRGHRRTYIGAMPGKIIQAMKKAKSHNPLLLLDEMDKITRNYMGDPAAALLEVLDPEQNNSFMDNYLEVEYDLSEVLFFCTANSVQDIPSPLQDRMEMIYLSGYTELEKQKIFTSYLISKQLAQNGLKKGELKFRQDAILSIIRHYTKEAGIRDLERHLSKICRKAVSEFLKKDTKKPITVTTKRVHQYLGVPIHNYEIAEGGNEIGTAIGLAWNNAGGDLLNIEITEMKGKGRISLTGKLGDVMQESAKAAVSYVRSRANALGISSNIFQHTDLHIHVPEGATPKDGPSAGIALIVALVSALTSIPINKQVALTGEITLRGKVLPIGGLKEKLMAARRGLIQHVIIPKENEKNLVDIPKEILDDLVIHPISTVNEAFPIALEEMPRFFNEDEDGTAIPVAELKAAKQSVAEQAKKGKSPVA